MQAIGNSYRGFGLLLQLGADRVFVLVAILISMAVAANVGLHMVVQQVPPSIGFF